jgi:hypothetical protein
MDQIININIEGKRTAVRVIIRPDGVYAAGTQKKVGRKYVNVIGAGSTREAALQDMLMKYASTYAPSTVPRSPRTPASSGSFPVGSILVSSWGYGQTNISFYQVIALTAQRIAIRGVGTRVLSTDGFNEKVIPDVSQSAFLGGKVRYVKHPSNGYVKLDSYRVARLWDGTPEQQTDSRAGN